MIKLLLPAEKAERENLRFHQYLYALTRENISSVLADCDAEAPNVLSFFRTVRKETHEVVQHVPVIDVSKCTFCGKCHEYCNYNAIFILPPSGIISVIEDLCHGCGACSVACEFDAITEKPFPLGNVNISLYNNSHPVIEARMNTGIMSPVRVIKEAIRHIRHEAEIVIWTLLREHPVLLSRQSAGLIM